MTLVYGAETAGWRGAFGSEYDTRMTSTAKQESAIVRVRPCSGLVLEILLSTGEFVYVDARRHLSRAEASKLTSDPGLLAGVSLRDGTIVWPTGAAISCATVLSSLAPSALEAAVATVSMGRLEPLASRIALTNLGYFLPHFTYPITKFELAPGQSRELADHLILAKGRGILFQLKERKANSSSSLEDWFANKVLKKAKSQVGNSRVLLSSCARIPVTNLRGHSTAIASSEIGELHSVVCYSVHNESTNAAALARWIFSKSAGFIHVLSIQDYERLIHTLVTLSELLEYLVFRQQIIERWHHEGRIPSESALLGQFIRGDDNARPSESYSSTIDHLDEYRSEFDLSFFLQDFERDTPTYDPTQHEFTDILAEFSLLNRTELQEARKRILRCVEYSSNGQDLFKCYRMIAAGGTGSAFLFVGFGPKERGNIEKAFMNLAVGCKYDLRVDRQIAVGVWRMGTAFNFRWCLIDGQWYHMEPIERMLREANPFRGVKPRILPRYRLR